MNITFIENDFLRLAFLEDGSLSSLYNKRTNKEFITRALVKPGPGRPISPWKLVTTLGKWYEHPIYNFDQELRMKKESNTSISISYSKLRDLQGIEFEIKLTVKIMLENDESLWSVSLENNSCELVEEIWFPIITGLTRITEKGKNYLVLPRYTGEKIQEPLDNLLVGFPPDSSRCRPPSTVLMYPGYASMSWMNFFSEEQGLYMASYDESFSNTGLISRKTTDKDSFYIAFAKYPFIHLGEKWGPNKFVISLHEGDWHTGARKYREYANRWIKIPRKPRWIQETNGWMFIPLLGFSDSLNYRFSDLPRLYEIAKMADFNTLVICGWFSGCNEGEYPTCMFQVDPRLGMEDEFRRMIKRIEDDGGKVVLYTWGRIGSPRGEWFEKTGREIVAKDRNLVPYMEQYDNSRQHSTFNPVPYFVVMCPSCPESAKIHVDIANYVRDLGAQGTFFDQVGDNFPYLCFSKDHPHKNPSQAFAYKRKVWNEIRKTIKERDPNHAMITETVCDAFMENFDIIHGLASFSFVGAGSFIEMFTYTFPEFLVTNRTHYFSGNPPDLRKEFNWAFALGLRFDFEYFADLSVAYEFPKEDIVYIGKLGRLREQLKDYLMFGTFKDTEGIRLDPPQVIAKVFEQKEHQGKAVTLFNPFNEEFKVKLEMSRKTDSIEIFSIDNETDVKLPPDKPIVISLQPQEVKVIIIRD